MFKYHNGLTGSFIWPMHITIGLIFLILGSLYLNYYNNNDNKNKDLVGQIMAYMLIVFSVLMISYHSKLLLANK